MLRHLMDGQQDLLRIFYQQVTVLLLRLQLQRNSLHQMSHDHFCSHYIVNDCSPLLRLSVSVSFSGRTPVIMHAAQLKMFIASTPSSRLSLTASLTLYMDRLLGEGN
jgi:hypothetical protein